LFLLLKIKKILTAAQPGKHKCLIIYKLEFTANDDARVNEIFWLVTTILVLCPAVVVINRCSSDIIKPKRVYYEEWRNKVVVGVCNDQVKMLSLGVRTKGLFISKIASKTALELFMAIPVPTTINAGMKKTLFFQSLYLVF